MKLLVSNQYGAMVMALMPFLYGVLLSRPIPQHLLLLFAWISLYLMSYPFLNFFKGKSKTEYKKWSIIYGIISLIFAIPCIIYNWHIIVFFFAFFPFLLINIYFTRKKDERNIWNDFAGVTIFIIVGMAAYYFPDSLFDEKIYWIVIYFGLFFIGTILYVKSVLRERKNPRYFYASIIFHFICISIFLGLQQYIVTLAFFPAFIRSVYLPYKGLSVKQTGMIEFIISGLFFIILIMAI